MTAQIIERLHAGVDRDTEQAHAERRMLADAARVYIFGKCNHIIRSMGQLRRYAKLKQGEVK